MERELELAWKRFLGVSTRSKSTGKHTHSHPCALWKAAAL